MNSDLSSRVAGVLALACALAACGTSAGAPDAQTSPVDGATERDGGPTDSQPADGGAPTDGGGSTDVPPGTVTLLAGQTSTGFADGTAQGARFSGPSGAALSADGSVMYVADTFNSTIRRVDLATGVVTTIAGRVQVAAATDGIGLEATLQSPRAMALAPDGAALYVADGPTIRRLDLTSLEVRTVAGTAAMPGNVDAIGEEARLGFLQHSYAFSPDGALLYIADRSNKTLRTFDPVTRAVTTVAGAPYPGSAAVHADGIGAAARFAGIGGLVWSGSALYIVDTFNRSIRRFDPATREVTTFVGDPTMQGNLDGVGRRATFETPQSIASDGTSLWVTGFNGVLRRVGLESAAVETVLGSDEEVFARDGVRDEVRLGLAFGPPLIDRSASVLYFQDRDASSIRAIDLRTLAARTVAGSVEPRGDRDAVGPAARFDGPSDVVCTASGARCYVADSGNHAIRVLDRTTGAVSTLAGRSGEPGAADGTLASARFAAPSGLALDEARELLYVADTVNGTLREVNLATGTARTIAGAAEEPGSVDGVGQAARLLRPTALALRADGSVLYVGDGAAVRTFVVESGRLETLAGDAATPDFSDGAGLRARFRSVSSLALDAANTTLFVADRSSSTVRAIALRDGVVSTLAGRDRMTGVADGPLVEALFDGPNDVLEGADERLYVLEGSNAVVRMIDRRTGDVSLWLGNAVVSGNPPAEVRVPWARATLFAPSALARAGNDALIVAEDALLLARPAGGW